MCYQVKKTFAIISIILIEVICIQLANSRIHDKYKELQVNNKYIISINKKISSDIKCFPVSMQYQDSIYYEDSFGAYRENGGHEGCDIMYDANTAGIVPVISATDGKVTNLGWLYLGGYRVGITSENGIYYYYAHFDSCAPSLFVGKEVKAGEFLGFMGDSGVGEEGTKGKFPVHLHFGIYVEDENGNEKSVNPYHFLLKINKD